MEQPIPMIIVCVLSLIGISFSSSFAYIKRNAIKVERTLISIVCMSQWDIDVSENLPVVGEKQELNTILAR